MQSPVKPQGVSFPDDEVLAMLNSCKKKSNPFREQFQRIFPEMRKKQVTKKLPLVEILNKLAPAMGRHSVSTLRNWWRAEVKRQNQTEGRSG